MGYGPPCCVSRQSCRNVARPQTISPRGNRHRGPLRPSLTAWQTVPAKNLSPEAKTTADFAAPPGRYKIVLPLLPQDVGSLPFAHAPEGAGTRRSGPVAPAAAEIAAGPGGGALRAGGPVRPPPHGIAGLSACSGGDQCRYPDHEAARRVFGSEVPEAAGDAVRGDDAPQRHDLEDRLAGSKKRICRLHCGRAALWRHLDRRRHDAALHAEITAAGTSRPSITASAPTTASRPPWLGRELENLHRLWRQIFLRYYASQCRH